MGHCRVIWQPKRRPFSKELFMVRMVLRRSLPLSLATSGPEISPSSCDQSRRCLSLQQIMKCQSPLPWLRRNMQVASRIAGAVSQKVMPSKTTPQRCTVTCAMWILTQELDVQFSELQKAMLQLPAAMPLKGWDFIISHIT